MSRTNADRRQDMYAQIAVVKQDLDVMYGLVDEIENCDSGSPVPPTEPEQPEPETLWDRITDYTPIDISLPTQDVAQSFSSIEAMMAVLRSKDDHNGAVYHLQGGSYESSANVFDVRNRSNFTLYSDPADPAYINGKLEANFPVIIHGENVDVHDINVLGFDFEAFRGHGVFIGGDSLSRKGGDRVSIVGNTFRDTSNAYGGAIVVRDSKGHGGQYLIADNKILDITKSNPVTGKNVRGEGIYVGSGNESDQWAQDITIVGNRFERLKAEAIDIKRYSRNIRIMKNWIEDCEVSSQGAIVLGLDPLRTDNFSAEYLCEHNVIKRVATRAYDGNGITAHFGYTMIRENWIEDTADHAIDVYADANEINDEVHLIRNHMIRFGGGQAIRENVGTANRGPKNPCRIIKEGNTIG